MSWFDHLPIVGNKRRKGRQRRLVRLFLTGFAMGSADIVPGVSGGTVALLLGVYEELIYSIKVASGEFLKLVVTGEIKKAVKIVPWGFLVPLGIGLMVAVVSLASLLRWLLHSYPVLVWAFFFGLIVASVWVVSKRVVRWGRADYLALVVGAVAAFLIVGLVPVETPDTLWAFFLSGMVAIIAMIMPGISGSFILVILGKYSQVLSAVTNHDFARLGVLIVGAVVGLAVFSRILSWLFSKHHDLMIAILSGFMLGSLRKVWPWKEVLETRLNSHGELVPLVEKNVLPGGVDVTLIGAGVLAVLAFVVVMQLERMQVTRSHVGDVGDKGFSRDHMKAMKKELK